MKKNIVPIGIIACSIVFSFTIIAKAAPGAGDLRIAANLNAAGMEIAFPIAELGGCTSKANCKAFCDKDENVSVCVDFALKSGMISEEDAADAKKFSDVLKGEGPGGCKDKKSCMAYCDDSAHAVECLGFAEKHGLLTTEELKDAKRVAKALSEGVALPGGCKNRQSCEVYCADTAHVDECIVFAEKAGMMSPEELAEAKRVLPLISAGKSPGGCKTKDACMAYCNEDGHFDECIGFAEEAGLVNKEEAAMARRVGGKGPGGCKSKESCEAYCNKDENAEVCFAFAKEKGILSEKEVREIEDGMGRLRSGLAQLPPEFADCVKTSVGADAMNKIQAGTLVPSRALGEKVKACVNEFLPKIKETLSKAMKLADAETEACLKQKLGEGGIQGLIDGDSVSADSGDVVKSCFDKMRMSGLKRAQSGLAKMPPEMKDCITQKAGANILGKIASGDMEAMTPEVGQAFQDCAGVMQAKLKNQVEQNLSRIPDEARVCVMGKLGGDYEIRLQNGDLDPTSIQSVVATCMKDMQFKGGAPEGVPPSGPPPGFDGGAPPSGGGAGGPSMDCSQFQMAPSCDFVPPGPPQEACRKCKGQ